ncbi:MULTISPECIES: DapH/DapD/GlmU-related protein [Citrobacter]|uniref:DapH/DapD/GlmU-related protein n=1 Tax=Citrobacter TaxID=544 RepID=UPI001901FD67|nr:MULTISPECIES: DapH/DapD/GlmU-related protein [Citrobacter]EKW1726627.1 transferase [Citrobacter freundii]ELS0843823.1 transferase [Citrobacter freundii]MBJ8800881.1 transferase [Citrobacter freundii]MDM3121700.1 transferase [Citrobacter sp. Cf125]HBV0977308.1 transferase [Citrobacter freundii]
MFKYTFRIRIISLFSFISKCKRKLNACFFNLLTGHKFRMVGINFKLYIKPFDNFDKNNRRWIDGRIGDNCWIEAVYNYGQQNFSPVLNIGQRLCLSDNVHISCASSLTLGDDVLIGSKVYIGDHSHGSYKNNSYEFSPPADKTLDDFASVKIGNCCWIGDNAVILAGSDICDGCVIAANAVVKGLKVDKPCLIGGVPAKVLKVF